MSEAAREAYQAGEDDETLERRVLVDPRGKPTGRFQDGDIVTIILYHQRLNARVAFSPEEEIRDTLSETLSLPIRCKKASAKCSTALVPWGANCFSLAC
jgi:hypothetical protein